MLGGDGCFGAFDRSLDAKALGLVEVLAQKGEVGAGLALDVVGAGECLVVSGGGVAVDAVLAKAHERQGVGRDRGKVDMPGPLLCGPSVPAPEPAVLRGFAVSDHDRGALLDRFELEQIGDAAGGGGGGVVHLLDHDGAVGDWRRVGRRVAGSAVFFQPVRHFRGVPDQDRHVRGLFVAGPDAVGEGGDEGAGVSHGLVHRPVVGEAAMAIVADEVVERPFVLVERDGAGVAHGGV